MTIVAEDRANKAATGQESGESVAAEEAEEAVVTIAEEAAADSEVASAKLAEDRAVEGLRSSVSSLVDHGSVRAAVKHVEFQVEKVYSIFVIGSYVNHETFTHGKQSQYIYIYIYI